MSTPAAKVVTKLSLPSKVYQALIKSAEPFVPKKLQPLWNHAAGNFRFYILRDKFRKNGRRRFQNYKKFKILNSMEKFSIWSTINKRKACDVAVK